MWPSSWTPAALSETSAWGRRASRHVENECAVRIWHGISFLFLHCRWAFKHAQDVLFPHLFAGSKETDINMTLLPLQQLPNLQGQDRAIDGENVVHQCHCQQTHLKTEKTSKNESLPEGQVRFVTGLYPFEFLSYLFKISSTFLINNPA